LWVQIRTTAYTSYTAHAVQTGGSGGIGSALTILFKRAGCNVIITGSNEDKLNTFLKSLPTEGGKAWAFACDLRNRQQVNTMVQKAAKECPPIDILINNVRCWGNPLTYTDISPQAGYALTANAPFWEQDMDNVESVMDVNLNGLMSVTRECGHSGCILLLTSYTDAVLKYHMMTRKPQPKGTIVNISSITGHQAPLKESFEASYHTSKVSCPAY
jgi:NAD(P)-dependent dehydrogenase (short-subunit alcohol dehydrogenase family)